MICSIVSMSNGAWILHIMPVIYYRSLTFWQYTFEMLYLVWLKQKLRTCPHSWSAKMKFNPHFVTLKYVLILVILISNIDNSFSNIVFLVLEMIFLYGNLNLQYWKWFLMSEKGFLMLEIQLAFPIILDVSF